LTRSVVTAVDDELLSARVSAESKLNTAIASSRE
jgi:hypothetical protein